MKINIGFKRELQEFFGEKELRECYQCGKCSSFCPVFWRDSSFNPRKIIEMAHLGIREILEKDSIWRCTTCYECAENCPQNLNFVDLIIGLRNLAVKYGAVPKEVKDEILTIQREGFILPETGRIKKLKTEIGLPLTENKVREEIVKIVKIKEV